jgi:hypothetical protein
MHHRKTKKRGGGWFDGLTSSQQQPNTQGWFDGISQQANSYWNSASSTLSEYNPFKKSQTSSTSSSYMPSTSYTSTGSYGGRKRRTRHKRGGSRMTNFPLSPAPYAAGPSISYNLVGGKTRKHRKHHRKSRKH